MDTTRKPTPQQFAAFQAMFDYFNRVLFADELPHAILTFDRHSKAFGYYAPDRWVSPDGELTPEIALGAAHLATGTLDDVVSTVAHEMVHHWQRVFGSPGRRGYHNTEWGQKMESIGLMPSQTGKPGGKKVGEQMDHYIIPDGRYARAFAEMPAECRLPWQSREIAIRMPPAVKGTPCLEATPADGAAPAPSSRNKVKYTCPSCKTNIWGKPEINVRCGDCNNLQMMSKAPRTALRAEPASMAAISPVALALH